MESTILKEADIGDILKSIPTSLFLLDVERKVVEANPSARELLGENIEGKKIEEVFEIDELDDLNKVWAGEIIQRKQVKVDGVPIGYSASPIYSNQNRIIGAAIILRDLTKIKEMEEQLRRKDRLAALGEMSAGMAHEIRNPLAAIKAGIEYISKNFEKGSDYHNYVKIILSEIERLTRIVKDMMEFAKQRTPKKNKVDMENLISNTIAMYQEEVREKGIELETNIEDELICMADSDQITTVLNNLILNSIEAIDREGQIKIKGRENGKNIEVEVQDNGEGIPEDMVKKVFNPFFTTKNKGTGLGLSITHTIIQNHSGMIKASNIDNGTCFTFKIPKGL